MERAILRTVLYADVFNYALTIPELHQYLIHHAACTVAEVQSTLLASHQLQDQLTVQDGFVALKTRSELITLRQQRAYIAKILLQHGETYGRWLASLPFVEMVAITGATAMQNPSHKRDDFLLIVRDGRVWLTRACSIILVRWARLWSIELCPNYVFASNQLPQKRTDLYIAHEIAQMLPLFGHDLYCELLAANHWAVHYLPNMMERTHLKLAPFRTLKHTLEWVFGGALGNQLEQWEYRRKSALFKRRASEKTASAQIDAHTVKGHFQDHGQRILAAYEERLVEYGIS